MSDTPSTAARAASAFARAAGSAGRETRAAIRRNPMTDRVYRTTIGVVGGTTFVVGLALIPLPGPGSLIAIGGLALLGTEFERAQRAHARANEVARKAVARANEARLRRAARRSDAQAAYSPPA
ncbi:MULTISPECIES: PGPGW domain-containing protein [unclassified Leucobacter]|uniref:PGPGW domain-containing protein n=1 Tax=unclassified Leucobacter TaxID=2621730 RepID=UPI00165E1C23|nr:MULTISPECIES: PGPGW domain-containing protein [unclassified Leucobacter]MBC9927051.1 PGPGW domain-containing protein [Leucobacter sp. cx-169]MBC9936330.1 PGPGW domain-containing protein [Leucobacter sp. cx-87]